MANPRQSSQNPLPGVGISGSSQPTGNDVAFRRPFALHEALPYTSFTSIIPFDSSVLPAPSIGSASPAPSLQDLTPNHEFDSLNQEILAKGLSSKKAQQTLSQVQRLIERGNITEYRFKTGPATAASSSTTSPFPTPLSLTPFSKMVYDQASIPFRYPTPETPSSISPNGQPAAPTRIPEKQSSPAAQKAVSSKQSANAQKNKQAHAHNLARLEIVLPTKSQLDQAAAAFKPVPSVEAGPAASVSPKITSQAQRRKSTPSSLTSPQPDAIEDSITVTPVKTTPQVAPGSQPRAGIAVELPVAPFNKSEFLVVPDEPEEPVNLSRRKRKIDGLDGDDIYGESLDLRQRADAAFRELRVFVQHCFEAEDAALRSQSNNDVVFFVGENDTTLTAAAQSKLQTLIGKTISLNCFQSAPLDDLLRLSRLSEGALRQAGSLEIKIEESWGDADVGQWVEQLPALDNAIKAARTCLRMMCGGRQEKQLYSEDVIDQSLDLFKRVMDGIIIPVAEMRSSGNTAELFTLLSAHKKKIVALLNDCQKLFSLMSTLISKMDTSDTVSNTLEFTASRLIFMETAHAERESVIDTQKFDGLRLVAMDMLSQIFLLNPAQRQGIFDEILTSLEKLPLGKRARTFKLVDGTSIQPVSALMMRLVQTSAGQISDAKLKTASESLRAADGGGEDGDNEGSGAEQDVSFSIRDEDHAAVQNTTAIQELIALTGPLTKTTRMNAIYVINYIVERAMKSTKTGDTPYRNLLDLFVEDFTSCLDNPDWPGAELLLTLLTSRMFNILEKDKTASVTAKNMALELLGIIGAAISKLRGHVRKTASALDVTDDLGRFLSDLASGALELNHRPENMVAWTGPYRATLEYLEGRFSEDQHLASAITFIITDWADKVGTEFDGHKDEVPDRDEEFGRLAYRLREMIQDRHWLSSEYAFSEVSANQAKLSYSITLLASQLCRSFSKILNILLYSMASDLPTVRSKSLKSINQVLETDPSILDGDSVVIQLILRCTNDSSTQVRDSALGLIGKCISMRPGLENRMVDTIVERFVDTGLGVRKRAMKLAKDIYLRNSNRAVRSAIANGLLHRVQDPEETVRDLARQVIEEIWFLPFYGGENSAETKTSIADHVALMIQTVKHGNVTNVLDKVLQSLFAPESKTAKASMEVCTKLVASMFDLVDNPDSDDPSVPSGRNALQVLMIFAKAEASLFTFEQLRLLMPHIMSIKSNEDLAVSRAVVVIYRRVLPQLSSAHDQFLSDVRKHLQPAVSNVTRALLDDIIACLWIISTLLKDAVPIAALTRSCLKGIKNTPKVLDGQNSRRLQRYTLIVGMIGKHCDLDSHHEFMKKEFPEWKGTNVSELMINIVLRFTSESQPEDIRRAALDCIGLICQSWPRNYTSPKVYTTFQQVFDSQIPALESTVLRSFKEFLFSEEKRSEQASEAPNINGTKPEKKRELTVMGGTNYDDVASGTARRFLESIIRIAKATQDEHAFLAIEVLASINRQGLTHPKETGVTFITLETSSNPRISELAYLEHKALHAKHETVIEREYVNALKEVFAYQRDIVKDPRGATANPFTPKLQLMMEVLKISKSKNRQKFIEKLCNQIDFDLPKLENPEDRVQHVQYSCFLVENLAFFEYLTVGEVHSTVGIIEKLVTSTGATVAQAVESEVFQVRMDALDSNPTTDPTTGDLQMETEPEPSRPDVDMPRLQQLTAGSMILLALWEVRTHLRRLYGMGTGRRDSKSKDKPKDMSKTPIKVPSVTGEKVWEEISIITTALTSCERMMETCKAFVELMSVDKEFMIQNEDDEMNGEEPTTPGNEDDDDDDERPSAGRGRKRKAGGTTPGARKKRARSTSQPRKRGRPKKQSLDADADGEMDEGDWC